MFFFVFFFEFFDFLVFWIFSNFDFFEVLRLQRTQNVNLSLHTPTYACSYLVLIPLTAFVARVREVLPRRHDEDGLGELHVDLAEELVGVFLRTISKFVLAMISIHDYQSRLPSLLR